ncbi:hypothetical protein ANCCEY_02124 [Ancylostoma ceylanicum]|uniref:Regulator of microtubule dynamics protein 1 n=1 Tax=Ancylostoma ceylanicum TaxID=53326 RepID=A0A0D6M3M1_9BILA|nr:hypothetical protein ANCCEY_02124 [Ancylostoma ceylanicum]
MYKWPIFFRIARDTLKLTPRLQQYGKFTRRVLATGLSSSLALSLFSSAPQPEQAADTSRPKNFDIIVRETDALYDSYLIDNAYNILKKFAGSDCSELLWRLARVVCEKAKLSKDESERKRLMYEAYALVQKAIEKEPKEGCFGAHKWYAILLDYIGEIEGNKSRIQKSYEVKEHLERALQICSSDATTWHILGIWHFSFADMGYATRLVAKAIFGTPPTSTYENALHYFLKAEEISPRFYSTNTYYIGETYEKMGNREEAMKYYKDAFRMSVVTADDRIIHQKAHEKLRKAGVKDSELLQKEMSPPAGKEPKVNELPPNFSFTRDDPFYFGPATCNLMHYTPAAYMAGFVEMVMLLGGSLWFWQLHSVNQSMDTWVVLCMFALTAGGLFTTALMVELKMKKC